MPCQTPQPWRQMKDLRDHTTLGGTARVQGTKELAGPKLVGTGFLKSCGSKLLPSMFRNLCMFMGSAGGKQRKNRHFYPPSVTVL